MALDISQAISTYVKMRAAIDEISREAKEKTAAINKLNCKDWMQNNDGIMPPGVGYTKEIVVQIRKGTGK